MQYCIVRFFKQPGKASQVRRRGLTLEEANEHCSRPETTLPGVWFDGFTTEAEAQKIEKGSLCLR